MACFSLQNELYAQNELLSNFNRRFIAQGSLIVRNASIYRALREVSACKLSYRSKIILDYYSNTIFSLPKSTVCVKERGARFDRLLPSNISPYPFRNNNSPLPLADSRLILFITISGCLLSTYQFFKANNEIFAIIIQPSKVVHIFSSNIPNGFSLILSKG